MFVPRALARKPARLVGFISLPMTRSASHDFCKLLLALHQISNTARPDQPNYFTYLDRLCIIAGYQEDVRFEPGNGFKDTADQIITLRHGRELAADRSRPDKG